jgi:hypothetical protein
MRLPSRSGSCLEICQLALGNDELVRDDTDFFEIVAAIIETTIAVPCESSFSEHCQSDRGEERDSHDEQMDGSMSELPLIGESEEVGSIELVRAVGLICPVSVS